MSRRSKLPIPLTLESLKEVEDGNLPYELYEYYLDLCDREYEVWQANGGMIEPQIRHFQRSLSRGLRYVVSYQFLYGDVLNGGIPQYFYNQTPRQIGETLDAFEAIGEADAADALSCAMAIYASKYDWPAGSDDAGFGLWEVEDPELEEIPLNDATSYRDYAILDRYLREHLEEVV